jgi:hypothetical protein
MSSKPIPQQIGRSRDNLSADPVHGDTLRPVDNDLQVVKPRCKLFELDQYTTGRKENKL